MQPKINKYIFKKSIKTKHARELTDWKFKANMINMQRALKDKVDSIQEQMSDVSKEMEILRKNQKEMLGIKNTVTKMKNAFDGLTGRLVTAEERISELEDISKETFKTENQREQRLEKRLQYPKIVG